jgi:hypothetical protein
VPSRRRRARLRRGLGPTCQGAGLHLSAPRLARASCAHPRAAALAQPPRHSRSPCSSSPTAHPSFTHPRRQAPALLTVPLPSPSMDPLPSILGGTMASRPCSTPCVGTCVRRGKRRRGPASRPRPTHDRGVRGVALGARPVLGVAHDQSSPGVARPSACAVAPARRVQHLRPRRPTCRGLALGARRPALARLALAWLACPRRPSLVHVGLRSRS